MEDGDNCLDCYRPVDIYHNAIVQAETDGVGDELHFGRTTFNNGFGDSHGLCGAAFADEVVSELVKPVMACFVESLKRRYLGEF